MRFSSMIGAIFLFFVTESICLSQSSQLNQYIKHYEIVQHQIVLHRSESNFVDEDVWVNHAIKIPDVEVRFTSFENLFHLQLTEDLSFLTLSGYSSEHSNMTPRFYEGVLKNTPGSSVIGYLYNDVFHGVITNGSISYYLEPAKYFIQNYSEYKALIYRNKDVFPLKSDVNKKTYKNKTSHLKNSFLNQTFNYFKQNKILKFTKRFGLSRRSSEDKEINLSKAHGQTDPTCQMEMVSDHTFYNFYDKNMKMVKAVLYFYVKYADSVFRTVDFDGDGHPDRIRLRVTKVSVKKSIKDSNYPMASNAKNINDYIHLFYKMPIDNCVSFCVCARDFNEVDFGTSQGGSVCSGPKLNKGAMTILNGKSKTYPLAMILYTFTHEMGHIFGAEYDEESNSKCYPKGKDGHYIMAGGPHLGTDPNNRKFSPCSIAAILSRLKEKGRCIKPLPAKCGNGIREGKEECDCGDSSLCHYLDQCCTPSDVKKAHSYVELKSHQDEACHIRRTKGYECSPAESNCCTKSCKKSKDRHCTVQFRSEILCSANGLSNCVCLQDPCLICCKVNNTCVSAKSLGFPGYTEAQEGTNCTTLGSAPVNETAVDNGNSMTDWRFSLFFFSFLFLILFYR